MQVLEALNAEPVTFNVSRNDDSELSEPRPQAVDMYVIARFGNFIIEFITTPHHKPVDEKNVTTLL